MGQLNAIVTGGSDGIGKALVLKLGQQGYNVITIGRSQTKIEQLRKEFASNQKVRLIAHCGDLLDEQDFKKFSNLINKNFRQVDVLINNAGFQIANDLLEQANIEAIQQMFKLHTLVPLELYKLLYPKMKQRGNGIIINIVSVVVHGYLKETYGPYTLTKYAEYGLGKMMVKEASKHNIKVTNVILGGANTNIRKDNKPEYLNTEDIAEIIINVVQSPKAVFIPEIQLYPKIQLSN